MEIWKKKSVEQYSAVPYLATFANCGLWVLYGLPVVHPHSMLVVTVNGTGFLIEIVYISLFLAFCLPEKRLRVAAAVAAECVFLAALALLVFTLAHSTKLRSDIVGTFCMIGSIVMYASPLSVMKLVIKTRSVEYMPFFISLFSFLNGISWTAYALIRFDIFIAAPNGMGGLLGLAQLLLYATFYRSTKRIMAERKKVGGVGEVGLAQPIAQLEEHENVGAQKIGSHGSDFSLA
ncbi:Bidirectional sugar transporter SWEET7 [Striga hermonthica]|uniref:Bidirectional sugar transporter SWEET n=1 Tax=Striga hermonthica TaxID=68872 RepID=A0A9N7NFV7_STRHE|nr:Bidirectional sugar transporter SWEET7 [Striga hermonthica]